MNIDEHVHLIQSEHIDYLCVPSDNFDFVTNTVYILFGDNEIIIGFLVLYDPCILNIVARFDINNRYNYDYFYESYVINLDNIEVFKTKYKYVANHYLSLIESESEMLENEEVDENKDYSKNITCPICLTYKINTCFIPCGHTACSDCAPKIDICHDCREPITKKMKIFI